MKFYKTGYGKELIKEVEVEKHTEHSVWIKSSYNNGKISRSAKHSNYDNFWETLEDAKEHLKEKYNRIIDSAERKIEKAKTDLEALNKY